METWRLFISIDLPLGVKKNLFEFGKHFESDIGVKWTPLENNHLTLKFLGNVPSDRVSEIKDKLEEVSRKFPEFEMVVKEVGAFPSLTRPRIIWAGITKGREEVKKLQKAVEQALKEMGFPQEEREFSPHVTIARVKLAKDIKKLTTILQKETHREFGKVLVEEIFIMRSKLTQPAPKYSRVAQVKLGER
jgi:2'-5' RNA ligase